MVRDKDGKPIIWSVEMAGSAASAQDGISVSSFPPGTVFSVGIHPNRAGDPSGFREGPLFKCPTGANAKATPPKAGEHCDSVQGVPPWAPAGLPTPRRTTSRQVGDEHRGLRGGPAGHARSARR